MQQLVGYMLENISKGDRIEYQPKNGGRFPTGEKSRVATVEAVRGSEVIVRQADDFTNRISPSQIL